MIASFNVGATIIADAFGWDALIYHAAARALLAGGDPWAPLGTASTFAGPPSSLLPYLATSWLPDASLVGLWTGLAAISAVFVLRRLHLPAWWLMFPPVSVAILAGSSALPVMALLVRGGGLADGRRHRGARLLGRAAPARWAMARGSRGGRHRPRDGAVPRNGRGS